MKYLKKPEYPWAEPASGSASFGCLWCCLYEALPILEEKKTKKFSGGAFFFHGCSACAVGKRARQRARQSRGDLRFNLAM